MGVHVRVMCIATALVTGAGGAFAQDQVPARAQPEAPKASQPEAKPDSKNEYSIETIGNEPGLVHQQLAKLVGEWETDSKFIMPGQPARESKGASKFTSVLGGRFLSEEDHGSMNGAEFASLKLWGFNSVSQRYESVWTYTGATSMMTMSGVSKDAGKTVIYDAAYDAGAGQKAEMSVTVKMIDGDHFTVSIAPKVPDGAPAPQFETSYSRKK